MEIEAEDRKVNLSTLKWGLVILASALVTTIVPSLIICKRIEKASKSRIAAAEAFGSKLKDSAEAFGINSKDSAKAFGTDLKVAAKAFGFNFI